MFRNISILFFNMIEARYALFAAISVLFRSCSKLYSLKGTIVIVH